MEEILHQVNFPYNTSKQKLEYLKTHNYKFKTMIFHFFFSVKSCYSIYFYSKSVLKYHTGFPPQCLANSNILKYDGWKY